MSWPLVQGLRASEVVITSNMSQHVVGRASQDVTQESLLPIPQDVTNKLNLFTPGSPKTGICKELFPRDV